MSETLSAYKHKIWNRLAELSSWEFPQFRSYRNADGTRTEREPVPEYAEREELIKTWNEIMSYENWFTLRHNPLLISLALWQTANILREPPEPMDVELQARIAISVFRNTPVCVQTVTQNIFKAAWRESI